MEFRKEFVIRIVSCLTELRDVKEFVGRIVMCLIELRAVNEFVRIIAKYPIEWRFARVCYKKCMVSD